MLRFGLYPGGAPDDPVEVEKALGDLEAGGAPLIVRAYAKFDDVRGADGTDLLAPADAEQYARGGRRLDVVAQYQSRGGDVEGYARFVRNLVGRFGAIADTLQITEEPNIRDNAALDGHYPDVLRAIAAGVAAAKDEVHCRHFTHLEVGVNSTPLFGPASGFYQDLIAAGGSALVGGLDYVGLDMFPDVFRPAPGGDVRRATRMLLEYHRTSILAPAGLGHLPLHITEHGWPTGEGRTPARQAEVLRDVVEAILEVHEELGVRAYELFSLRDADSAGPSLFHHFGIVTDRYERKPAFEVFADLVARGSDGQGGLPSRGA